MNSTYFLSLGSDAVVTLYCNYKTHPDILRFSSGTTECPDWQSIEFEISLSRNSFRFRLILDDPSSLLC